MSDTMREAFRFESYIQKHFPNYSLTKEPETGDYVSIRTQDLYWLWQAAQRQGGEAVACNYCHQTGTVETPGPVTVTCPVCQGTREDKRPPAPQPAVPERLHPSVLAFARAMQYKLDANKFKDGRGWTRNPDGSRSGWAGVSPNFLIEKLEEECGELIYEVQRSGGDLIWKEAADVGNIAMMLADVTDALAFVPESHQPHPDWTPCSERLPRGADADFEGGVFFWTPDLGVRIVRWTTVRQYNCMKEYITKAYWKHTGLQRPKPPEDAT